MSDPHEGRPPSMSMPAAVLAQLGEYQVLDLLGEGGMGLVYRALHTELGRVVALRDPQSTNGRRLYALAKPTDGGFDAVVVDADGEVYEQLFGYRTVTLPAPVDTKLALPLKTAMS